MAMNTSIPYVDWPVTGDGKTLFDTKNDALPPQLQALADNSAIFVTEANALRDEVNGFQLSASASAVAAANAQTAAEGFRDEAEGFKNDSQDILDSNTAIAAAVQSAAGLPSLTGNAGLALIVNETEDGVLWDNAGGERLTFTKSFNAGEEASYTLDGEGLIPVVSVTKEVPQIDLTNNQWDADVGGYEQSGSDLSILSDISIVNNGNSFDLSSASYDSLSLNISSQETSPSGVDLSRNGDKLIICGRFSGLIKQYTVSTVDNVSTATYDSIQLDVSGLASNLVSARYFDDGNKLLVVFQTQINVFNLPSQYSLTGATDSGIEIPYTDISIYTFSDACFSDDGFSVFFLAGNTVYNTVYQFDMPDSFNLETIVDSGFTLDLSNEDTVQNSIFINPVGDKLIALGAGTDSLYEYDLVNSNSLNGALYSGNSFSVAGQETSPSGLTFNRSGVKALVIGVISDSIYQYTTGSINYKTSQYIPAITNTSGQINTTFWTDINSMTASETLNGQTINYALSNDDRTTWKIGLTGNSPRNIVRNNGGTWEYNSDATYASETWTAATTNTEYDALSEAMAVAVNQMDSTQLQALTDAEQIVLGNELDLAVILYTNDSSVTPVFSGMTIDYDANIANEPAILGADYEWKSYGTSDITIKALTANNLKGRVL